MASYFNLTLDTLAPQGLTIKLNNGSQYTTNKTVHLAVNVTDESADGYQMQFGKHSLTLKISFFQQGMD